MSLISGYHSRLTKESHGCHHIEEVGPSRKDGEEAEFSELLRLLRPSVDGLRWASWIRTVSSDDWSGMVMRDYGSLDIALY
jgi:hypothetical protein